MRKQLFDCSVGVAPILYSGCTEDKVQGFPERKVSRLAKGAVYLANFQGNEDRLTVTFRNCLLRDYSPAVLTKRPEEGESTNCFFKRGMWL